jgi:hypothetical protein
VPTAENFRIVDLAISFNMMSWKFIWCLLIGIILGKIKRSYTDGNIDVCGA